MAVLGELLDDLQIKNLGVHCIKLAPCPCLRELPSCGSELTTQSKLEMQILMLSTFLPTWQPWDLGVASREVAPALNDKQGASRPLGNG